MELFIDNKRVKLKPKKYKTFGTAINDIRNYLEKHQRFPCEFYADGEKVTDNTIVDIEKLQVLEVVTKTESAVLLDTIIKARDQINVFFELFFQEKDEDDDSDEPFVYSEMDLVERDLFIRWFYNFLNIIKSSGDLAFIYKDFDNFVEDFGEEMRCAEEILEKKDYEGYLTELEYIIGILLDDFYVKVPEYYSDILNEENRKRLLN